MCESINFANVSYRIAAVFALFKTRHDGAEASEIEHTKINSGMCGYLLWSWSMTQTCTFLSFHMDPNNQQIVGCYLLVHRQLGLRIWLKITCSTSFEKSNVSLRLSFVLLFKSQNILRGIFKK